MIQRLAESTAAAVGTECQQLEMVPNTDDLRQEIAAGLRKQQKELPCKLFYDDHGSNLFEQICTQKEYYPTRTEIGIIKRHAADMARTIGAGSLFVEYGSGSSLKTRLLLDELVECAGYVPIDISFEQLSATAQALSKAYPQFPICPIHADYTKPIQLPLVAASESVTAYFPGSTIGNFEPAEALDFLRQIRESCGPGSGLLIGVDLKKEPALLHAAYNDAAGVTAQFNLNALRHINREIGADFNLENFSHYAFYHPVRSRVEMHLVSRMAHKIDLGDGTTIHFDEGESIHSESCHKYSLEGFRDLLHRAGYKRAKAWMDPKAWFSVQYFTADP